MPFRWRGAAFCYYKGLAMDRVGSPTAEERVQKTSGPGNGAQKKGKKELRHNLSKTDVPEPSTGACSLLIVIQAQILLQALPAGLDFFGVLYADITPVPRLIGNFGDGDLILRIPQNKAVISGMLLQPGELL